MEIIASAWQIQVFFLELSGISFSNISHSYLVEPTDVEPMDVKGQLYLSRLSLQGILPWEERKEGNYLLTDREAAAHREMFEVGSASSGLESRSVCSPTPSLLHPRKEMHGQSLMN